MCHYRLVYYCTYSQPSIILHMLLQFNVCYYVDCFLKAMPLTQRKVMFNSSTFFPFWISKWLPTGLCQCSIVGINWQMDLTNFVETMHSISAGNLQREFQLELRRFGVGIGQLLHVRQETHWDFPGNDFLLENSILRGWKSKNATLSALSKIQSKTWLKTIPTWIQISKLHAIPLHKKIIERIVCWSLSFFLFYSFQSEEIFNLIVSYY